MRGIDTAKLDLAPGELVEAQLDQLIDKRAAQGDPDAEAAAWARSVQRFNERARKENRARWYAFHADMCELHSRLAAEHEAKAQKLLEGAV